MAIQTQNPATGEVLKTFEPHTDAEVDLFIAKSVVAHNQLRKWSFEKRAVAMRKAAQIMRDEADVLGKIMTLEMGKTLISAIAEVKKCAAGADYYAETAKQHLADEIVQTDAQKSYRKFLPLGPVLAVMPWNYPIWQVIRFAAPALMAGNTALLKHASNVPQCASVAAICGEEIKPTVLELGGSDAFIIMPSADLNKAAEIGTIARTQNNGQSCIAAKRFIIHAAIYDEMKKKLVQQFEALTIGDPMKCDTDIGPLVNQEAVNAVVDQVEAALNDGAVRVCGAEAVDGEGYYYRPGILENIPKTSRAYSEEIFAPVALLFKVKSLDEALEIANSSPFGLGSAVFTQDKDEQAQAINELEAGATFINAMTISNVHLPFGGIKRSGYGRELAAEGIKAFCNTKTVYIA